METKLALLLTKKKMKLKELELKTGISHSTLSLLKTGARKTMEMSTATKIAEALGVKIDEVVGVVENN